MLAWRNIASIDSIDILSMTFQPYLSWPLVALLTCVALALMVLEQRTLLRSIRVRACAVVGVWRVIALAALVMLIVSPQRRTVRPLPERQKTVVLTDCSGSMGAMSSEGRSRREEAEELLNSAEAGAFWRSQGHLEWLSFASGTERTALSGQGEVRLTPMPGSTSLGEALGAVLKLSDRGTAVTSVLVVSDGHELSGRPALSVGREFRRRGIPVSALCWDRESQGADVRVKLSEAVLEAVRNEPFEIRGEVVSRGGIRGDVELELVSGGEVLSQGKVSVTEDGSVPFALKGTLPLAGHHGVTVRIRRPGIAGDIRPDNDEEHALVKVTEPAEFRVLYLSGAPDWEWRFLRVLSEREPQLKLSAVIRTGAAHYYRLGEEFSTEETAGQATGQTVPAQRGPADGTRTTDGQDGQHDARTPDGTAAEETAGQATGQTVPAQRGPADGTRTTDGQDGRHDAMQMDSQAGRKDAEVQNGRADRAQAREGVRVERPADGFPSWAEAYARYDAVVVDGGLLSELSEEQCVALRSFVEHKGGGLVIRGMVDVASARKSLLELLPGAGVELVQVSRPLALALDEGTPVYRGEAIGEMTSDGGLVLSPPGVCGVLSKPHRSARAVLSLGSPDGGQQVLSVQSFGAGRVAYLGVLESWRWALGSDEGERHHHALWRHLLSWLSETGKPLVRLGGNGEVSQVLEPCELRLEVLGDDFRASETATAEMVVTGPSGEASVVPLLASLEEAGQFAGVYTPLEAGLHRVRYRATRDGRTLHGEGVLLASATSPELEDTSAQPAVLEDLARMTGGRVFRPATFLSGLPNIPVSANVHTAETLVPLVPPWLPLAVFLASTSVAWWQRRRLGLA